MRVIKPADNARVNRRSTDSKDEIDTTDISDEPYNVTELVAMIPDGLGALGSQPQPLPSSNGKRSDLPAGNWPRAPNGVRLYSAVEVKSYEYVFAFELLRENESFQLS